MQTNVYYLFMITKIRSDITTVIKVVKSRPRLTSCHCVFILLFTVIGYHFVLPHVHAKAMIPLCHSSLICASLLQVKILK